MSDTTLTAGGNDRQQRALDWIRGLTEFPERFAGSAYERQAAELVGTWLRQLGFEEVSVASAPGGPRPGFVLALHLGLGLLGCYWGGLFGTLLALLALVSFERECRKRQPLLSPLLRPDVSANVVARCGAVAPQQRVILSAHIDTTQAGWMFTRHVAERYARTNQNMSSAAAHPQPPQRLPEVLLIIATLVALSAWIGAHGFLFGMIKLGACVALLIGFAITLQWGMSIATPGANDNASAVAAMLTCAEQLKATLPSDTELWVVGCGAEEVGSGGMQAFVDAHRDWPPQQTYYVNFECVGGGTLHYILSEGMLSRVTYPAALVELARRVAAGTRFGEVTPTHLLAGTDGRIPAEAGYPSLSLISLEANGVPRNYHRVEDTVDGIDAATVVRSADFGTAVAVAALQGAAGPIVNS